MTVVLFEGGRWEKCVTCHWYVSIEKSSTQ